VSGQVHAPASTVPLRVLIVEDLEWDAELMRVELARNRIDCETRRVEREGEFRDALDAFRPDIILADYTLPRFSALRAVRIVDDMGLDIPTILVSGTITEQVALTCLRAGVADYILKSNLLRLGPAVTAALEARSIRRENERARLQIEALSGIVRDSLHEIYVFNADTLRFLHANRAALANTGYAMEELAALTPIDLKPEFTRAELESMLRPLRSGAQDVVLFQTVHRRKDGTEYPVEAHVQLTEYMGETSFVGFIVDLESRRRAEDEHHALETRFSSFANSTSDGMIVADADGLIRYWNRAAESIFGYTREEALGQPLVTIIPERDRSRHLKGFEDVARGAKPLERTTDRVTGLHKSGAEIPVDLTLGSWTECSGRFYSAVARDVTEKSRAEERVRDAEEHLRALLEHLPIVTYEASPMEAGSLLWVSPQVEAFLGTPPDAWIENPEFLFSRIHPDDRDRVRDAVIEGRASGSLDLEVRIAHEDGHYLWTWDRAVLGPSPSADAGPVLRGVMIDITAAKEAERERALLSAAVEQASDLVMITDPDGAIEYTNPAFEEITGYSAIEALGENPRILKSGRQPLAFYEEMWAEITAGRPWGGVFLNRRKDGDVYAQRTTISPVLDREGHVQNFVAIGRDVSRELALERQLRQAQKMEAVGRLTGGIAHDFNNVLGAILTNAQLLSMTLPSDFSGDGSEVADIETAARRGADLIRRLMAFSRDEDLHLEVVDPSSVLGETEKLLAGLLPEHIELALDEDHRGALVALDRSAIQQILLNLATNARDAMPDGGTLSISTAVVKNGREQLEIEVRDTGVGMDEDTMERVFEPFFTTKRADEGTGLGLAMVHALVDRHGGTIDVSSQPGVGTLFKICLPVADATEQSVVERAEPQLSESSHEGRTVLLVEDEEPLRNAGRRVLEHDGYRVLTAEDGLSALRILEANRDEISLVLTDFIMPVMGGGELYDATRDWARRPPFVITTGHSPGDLDGPAVSGEVPILRKPWGAEALSKAVRHALDQAYPDGSGPKPAVTP
jgi:PAS domain S-box-containing protein